MVGGSAPKNRPRTSIYGNACWRFVRSIACISNGSRATPASAKTSAVISFAPRPSNRRTSRPTRATKDAALLSRWIPRESSLVARANCCPGSPQPRCRNVALFDWHVGTIKAANGNSGRRVCVSPSSFKHFKTTLCNLFVVILASELTFMSCFRQIEPCL